MLHADEMAVAVLWSAATITFYLLAKVVYRKWPRWWLTPLAVTPVLLIAVSFLGHASYEDYARGTHWMVTLLGPVTVAFAIPIHEHRDLILHHWPVLLVGVLVGSGTAMATAWCLASVLGLSSDLQLSLLPRSISTPFAMEVSGDIGGVPELTAVFVVFTGVFGASMGEIILKWLPLRSTIARGALLGMGAHGAGVAKAHQIGREEGSVAGLVMVLVGLVNVLAAPILAYCLRA